MYESLFYAAVNSLVQQLRNMSLTVSLLYIVLALIVVLCNIKPIRVFLSTNIKLLTKLNQEKSAFSVPGPTAVPFFGTRWIYFWKYRLSQLHEAYNDMNQRYGPIVMETTSSGFPIINLFARQDIEKVLRYSSRYPFRPPTEIVVYHRRSRPDRYASVGITNEQGEKWHHLRSKLTPAITSPRVLQDFLPTLNVICDDFIQLLQLRRDPETNVIPDFLDIANLMGLEAVCALMLGRRMGFLLPNQPPHVKQLASAVKQLFVTQRDSYYGMGLWKYIPTKTYRNFVRSEDTIYRIISTMVDESIKSEAISKTTTEISSVFHSILFAEGLDIRDKKSALIDFIAAGIETLANTLTFVLWNIGQSAEIQQRICDEFGDNGHPTLTSLSGAPFTKACIQETYRISPTAFCIARILEQDTILSGYNVKSGSLVLCQTMIACNNDSNFNAASTYLPDRWLTDNEFTAKPEIGAGLVLPFGVGKRTCPGKRFIEMELMLLVSKMVRTFNISFTAPLEFEFEFLLVPKNTFRIRLGDRQS